MAMAGKGQSIGKYVKNAYIQLIKELLLMIVKVMIIYLIDLIHFPILTL